MAKRRLAVLGFLAAGFGSSLATYAQPIQRASGRQFNVKVVGKVLDFADAPVPNATVGIASWRKAVWRPLAKSATDGSFEFKVQLDPGDYGVIAGLGAYEVASSFVRVREETADPQIIEVGLTAWQWDAKSDKPPTSTPPIGVLPSGSRKPFTETTGSEREVRVTGGPGDQESVNVFYATNRTPKVGEPAHYLDRSGVDMNMTYGVCTVHIPPTHEPGRLERPAIWRFERVEKMDVHIVITQRELISEESAFQQRLHKAFQESGSEAFLFVHGYNVDFDDAVRRTAQLFRDLQFNGVPILFSWPAQDAWWRYPAAEDAVNTSARQLGDFLLHMLANQRLTAVNVIAHSMGNRVLVSALERLALQQRNLQFKNIIMAAPDVNVADFNEVSNILRKSAGRTTVYASSYDVALFCSKVFHSYQRLGEAPPTTLAAGIDTIDASAIKKDVLGHSYFGDSTTVIRDMFLLINRGLDPQARYLQRTALGSLSYWVVPKE